MALPYFDESNRFADDEIKLLLLSGRMTHGVMTKMSLKGWLIVEFLKSLYTADDSGVDPRQVFTCPVQGQDLQINSS